MNDIFSSNIHSAPLPQTIRTCPPKMRKKLVNFKKLFSKSRHLVITFDENEVNYVLIQILLYRFCLVNKTLLLDLKNLKKTLLYSRKSCH